MVVTEFWMVATSIYNGVQRQNRDSMEFDGHSAPVGDRAALEALRKLILHNIHRS